MVGLRPLFPLLRTIFALGVTFLAPVAARAGAFDGDRRMRRLRLSTGAPADGLFEDFLSLAVSALA